MYVESHSLESASRTTFSDPARSVAGRSSTWWKSTHGEFDFATELDGFGAKIPSSRARSLRCTAVPLRNVLATSAGTWVLNSCHFFLKGNAARAAAARAKMTTNVQKIFISKA